MSDTTGRSATDPHDDPTGGRSQDATTSDERPAQGASPTERSADGSTPNDPVDTAYSRYRLAEELFEDRRYAETATLLRELVDDLQADPPGKAPLDVRQLLARAYFHSAQLGRAEESARGILEDYPDEAYTHLLLGRTLQRVGRSDEATPHLAMARHLGNYS